MKRMKYLTLLLGFAFLFMVKWNVGVEANTQNIQAPYYTYTVNSNGRFIRTREAYLPTSRITDAGGEAFGLLAHAYIDKTNDYLYVTDRINRAVYVYDENFNFH